METTQETSKGKLLKRLPKGNCSRDFLRETTQETSYGKLLKRLPTGNYSRDFLKLIPFKQITQVIIKLLNKLQCPSKYA
jgi:hypothetical protein